MHCISTCYSWRHFFGQKNTGSWWRQWWNYPNASRCDRNVDGCKPALQGTWKCYRHVFHHRLTFTNKEAVCPRWVNGNPRRCLFVLHGVHANGGTRRKRSRWGFGVRPIVHQAIARSSYFICCSAILFCGQHLPLPCFAREEESNPCISLCPWSWSPVRVPTRLTLANRETMLKNNLTIQNDWLPGISTT